MDHNNLSRISSSLYSVVDLKIGPEIIIDVRRTTTNLLDEVLNIEFEVGNMEKYPIFSGSKAEGFRFKTSDNDWMFLYRDIVVIPSELYVKIYHTNTTLLLMANEMTKPGFTLLRLLGKSKYTAIDICAELLNNGSYISSTTWREMHTELRQSDNEFTHGPCTSGRTVFVEYDFAYCLKCDIWPANARDCIKRLHQCGWPSHETILSIVNDGVLFVPIGAKQSYFENIEWRMSFSLAEKKLIHAMNHTQFLCYGLLKIFLKEAIESNSDVKGLLCSYFLKTSVFWEIVSSPNDWNPSTLLSKFWNCFSRILQWISCSYCPNFFIPNNMFQGKIEGANRDKILQYLTILYYEGFRCLTRCPSLMPYFALVINSQETLEPLISSKFKIVINIINEWIRSKPEIMHRYPKAVCPELHRLALAMNSGQKGFLLKMWFYQTLYASLQASINGRSNKLQYRNHVQRRKVISCCRIDAVGVYLHQAIMCYRIGKYNETIKLVQHLKDKISSMCTTCVSDKLIIEEKYKEAIGKDLTIETVLRKSFLDVVWICDDQCIPEFFIEIHGHKKSFASFNTWMPPLTSALFLQFLCYEKLGRYPKRDETLQELSLVAHGLHRKIDETLREEIDQSHMRILYRAITWQILGICQQMKGDNAGACHSYLMALHQEYSIIKVATCIRLGTILAQYL